MNVDFNSCVRSRNMEDGQEVVLTARRTESVDAPAVEKLTSSVTYDLFGRVDIVRVMYVLLYFWLFKNSFKKFNQLNFSHFSEKANLAVTLVSSDDDVVANGAFFDYPNLAVNQAKWETLFQESIESIKPTVSTAYIC